MTQVVTKRDGMRDWRTDMAPAEVLAYARQKLFPVYMNDPRRKYWNSQIAGKLLVGLTDEAISRAVQGPKFSKVDSMRYPSLDQCMQAKPDETKAVIIGLLAKCVQTLKAHATFETNEEYNDAFDFIRENYRDWSLADFSMAFQQIAEGRAIKTSYRFSLPELRDGLDKHQNAKIDAREKAVRDRQIWDEQEGALTWRMFQDTLGIPPSEQKPDRRDWLKGKDVMTWAEKEMLRAKDRERRGKNNKDDKK